MVLAEDKETLEKLTSEYVNAANNFVEDYKTNLKQKAEETTNSLTDIIKGIPDAINNALQQTATALQVLDKLSKGLREIDPKSIEKLYVEAGQDALAHTINSMIAAIKSSVTIVSAKLDWLDQELLKGLKLRNRLTIITDPSVHTPSDTKIIELLKSLEANVELRRFNSNREPILIAEKDAEMFLIGTPLTDKMPYAVITTDEKLITQFGQILTPLRGGARL